MQRVALINGTQKNYDFDLSKLFECGFIPGVGKGGLQVNSNGTVTPGYAFIQINRNSKNFVVLFYSDEIVNINLSGTGVVYIFIDQAKVLDGTNNNVDGTGIGSIVVASTLPAEGSYMQLASFSGTTVTDKRKFIKTKGDPLTLKWYDENGEEQELDFSSESNIGKVMGIIAENGENKPKLVSPSVDIGGLPSKTPTSDTQLMGLFGDENGKFQVGDLAPLMNLPWGDGSDGDVTISSTTTLTRDMNYNNLVVNSTLNTNGFKIFIKGALSGTGTIANNASGYLGGATGTIVGGSNGNPGNGNGYNLPTGLGGLGGSYGGASPRNGGTFIFPNTISIGNVKRIQDILGYFTICGGGTGGAGNNGGSGSGGGGGGVVLILANNITFTGNIQARGGDGIGSGGGGAIIVNYLTKTGTYTTNVAAGTGSGATGGVGNVYNIQYS